MQRPLILVALALVLLVRAPAATVAHAEAPSQETLARSHYVAGEEEYARGRWREALHEFQLGYALSPRPEFLINFAQVYRKLGDYDAAERECQRYLATAPPSELAQQAERLLQQIRDERARAAPPPAPQPGQPHDANGAPNNRSVQPNNLNVQPHNGNVQPHNGNVQPHNGNVQLHNGNVQLHNESVPAHNELPQPHADAPPRRRRWVVPVAIVGGVLVVGAAVTVGLVFGLDKRDTFAKPPPLGTVDFR